MKRQIESFKNSEDFRKIQEELQKWSDEFKKDIGRMKEDIFRPDKETKSIGTLQL
jgi:hypothetical protein